MLQYQYGHHRVYFARLRPVIGGEAIYKIGITKYKNADDRFKANKMYDNGPKWLDHYLVKIMRSVVVDSKADAELIESHILSLKDRDFDIDEQFSGSTEVRDYNQKQVDFLIKKFDALKAIRTDSEAIAKFLDFKKKEESVVVEPIVCYIPSNTERAKTVRYFGPPGTGKTTTLINKIEEYLDKGVEPKDIAFISFTKKAANEARDRMLVKFPQYTKDDLKNFTTLHSFSYHNNRELTGAMLMSEEDCVNVEAKLGYRQGNLFARDKFASMDDPIGSKLGSTIAEYGKYRNLGMNNAEIVALFKKEYEANPRSDYYKKLHNDISKYTEIKENGNKYDFSDTIEQFHLSGYKTCETFKVIIIDEAQDLSPQHWRAVEKLAYKCDNLYLAGDDDQAIFHFTGIKVEEFLDFKVDEDIILNQSYRIPPSVHTLAQKIIKEVKVRKEKAYLPKAIVESKQLLPFLKRTGSKMIVTMWHKPVVGILNNLVKENIYYKWNGQGYVDSVSANKVIELEEDVTKLEQELNNTTMSANVSDANNSPLHNRSLEMIRVQLDEAVRKWEYVSKLVNRGITDESEVEVNINNVHRIKGGEADHVMVIDSYSYAAQSSEESMDSLTRAYYVAVTRAKESLTILPVNCGRGSCVYGVKYNA